MTSDDPTSGPPYKRFIVLSGPRTGSTLLVDALNSSPEIVCFGELFNQDQSIDFEVEGYDATNAKDVALRSRSPGEFLSTRIFCDHPEEVRAVGFKFHYTHFWGFADIRGLLEEDHEILVLHLQRHNLLRVLVSLKIAEKTGMYIQRGDARARVSAMITRLLQLSRAKPSRIQVTITPDEFKDFGLKKAMTAKRWEEIFAAHQIVPISYEDMAANPQTEFARAQSFLGVTPSKLKIGLVRQNPQKLEELIENYDELRSAFVGGPAEWMFND